MNNQYIVLSKHVINNHQLSAEGLATIVWLMSKYGLEAKVDRELIRVRFGWGAHTWYKVSRELKKLGFVTEIISNKGSLLYFRIADILDSSDYLDTELEALDSEMASEVENGQL